VFAPANRDNKANHNPVSTRKANLRGAILCAAEELGNAVATIAIAKWEKAVDETRLRRVLDGEMTPAMT